jgi:hypothetical protein
MGRFGGIGAVALAALWIAVDSAAGATVDTYREPGNKSEGPPIARYSADPGERNNLNVSRAGGNIEFLDSGALIAAGSGCVLVDRHRARCSSARVSVYAGDMDDHLRTSVTDGTVRGGAGDDVIEGAGVLVGEDGADLVRGGPGNESIGGGPGRDRLFGGAGDDSFGGGLAGAAEEDRIDGGRGHDDVSYSRTTPVTIDLPHGRAGAPGEGDTLVSVESVQAEGGGTFLGNGRRNVFLAFRPATMIGGPGSDSLTANSPERDRLDGGSGNDALFLSDRWEGEFVLPERDALRCGPGLDTIGNPSPNTVIPTDCERARLGSGGPRVELPGRSANTNSPLAVIAWTGSCNDSDLLPRGCQVSGSVHEARWPDHSRRPTPGAALASGSGTISSDRRRLSLSSTRRGRRLLEAGRCVTALFKMPLSGYTDSFEVLYRFGRRCHDTAPLRP